MSNTFDLLDTVLAVVVDYYTANGLPLPERRYVAAGLPEISCDQITVRGVRRFPHTGDVANEEPQVFMQLAQEGIQVEIQIVRCAPAFGDDSGNSPSVSEMTARASELYDDSDNVLTAIREAVSAGVMPGCHGVVFLGWSNDGEDGNFMGGTTTLALTQVSVG